MSLRSCKCPRAPLTHLPTLAALAAVVYFTWAFFPRMFGVLVNNTAPDQCARVPFAGRLQNAPLSLMVGGLIDTGLTLPPAYTVQLLGYRGADVDLRDVAIST